MGTERYQPRTQSVYLPTEIICNILPRLPTKSFIRFQSVCKYWCKLVEDSCFINLKSSYALHQQFRNFILVPKDVYRSSSLILLDKDACRSSSSTCQLPIKDDSMPSVYVEVVSSCYGVLRFIEKFRGDPVCTYNPITKDFLRLPRLRQQGIKPKDNFRLGFDIKCRKYKVVRLYHIQDDDPYVKGDIVTLGDIFWRKLDVPYSSGYAISWIHNADSAFSDGAFHWIVKSTDEYSLEYILAMDIKNENFRVIELPESLQKKWRVLSLRTSYNGNICGADWI